MNSNTQSLRQYLATMLEMVENNGVQEDSLRIEVINEMVIKPSDDHVTSYKPTGKTMAVLSWRWCESDDTEVV